MTERLQNCDSWHPELPARLALRANGNRRSVRCLECQRQRLLAHRDELKLRQPYGVLPRLTWPPPERLLLADGNVAPC